jgi:hypothetical protein
MCSSIEQVDPLDENGDIHNQAGLALRLAHALFGRIKTNQVRVKTISHRSQPRSTSARARALSLSLSLSLSLCFSHIHKFRISFPAQHTFGSHNVMIVDESQENNLALAIVTMGMVELYDEKIYDLLQDPPVGGEKRKNLKIGINKAGNFVKDQKFEPVDNLLGVANVLKRGYSHVTMGATAFNERSSRAHTIITLKCIPPL